MAYSPAGNLTSSAGLAHLQTIYYKKRALDRLTKKFLFKKATYSESLPMNSGRTVQFFRYQNFSANTTQTAEGTVGTSQSLTSRVVGATVSQYSAYITVSDFLRDTAIDPIIQQASDLLGYQAGLTVDTITRNVIDAEYAGCSQTPLSTYLKVADLRAARHSLQANDVQGMIGDDEFLVVSHPFNTYDLVNDPAANGLADIFKYTGVKDTALVQSPDRGMITHVASCQVWESTNVKTVSTGDGTQYTTYIFGKEGVACIDLAGRGPSEVTDPRKQKFSIRVIRPDANNIADPEGVIGGAVAYNFIYTVMITEGPAGIGGAYRMRQIRALSSIG